MEIIMTITEAIKIVQEVYDRQIKDDFHVNIAPDPVNVKVDDAFNLVLNSAKKYEKLINLK